MRSSMASRSKAMAMEKMDDTNQSTKTISTSISSTTRSKRRAAAAVRPPLDEDGDESPAAAACTTGNNGSSALYVPPMLHQYYRQAARIFKIDYVCSLCSKPLKCRGARDMRDHALSHGGAQWSTAFRCQVCSYGSHSRRSVSKHVTMVHLEPDGLKTAPCELMENQTLERAEELLALVRACFPLPASNDSGLSTSATDDGGGFGGMLMMGDDTGLASELSALIKDEEDDEEDGTTGVAMVVDNSDGFNGESVQSQDFLVDNEDNDDEEDGNINADAYANSAPWIADDLADSDQAEADEQYAHNPPQSAIAIGWTVDDEEEEVKIEMNRQQNYGGGFNGIIQQQQQQQMTFRPSMNPSSNYPNAVLQANGKMVQQKNSTPVLEFQPASTKRSHPSIASVSSMGTTMNYPIVPPPVEEEPAEDPRALIERLLNVVAPDVARFLLEEAIRARAKRAAAAAAATTSPIAPIAPIVNIATIPTAGPSRRHPINASTPSINGSTVNNNNVRLPFKSTQKPKSSLTEAVNKIKDRLGKLGTFRCNECQSIFKRQRYLDRHIRARHRQQRYRCTMGGCTFMNARELWYVRRHHAKHHADRTDLVCQYCSNEFLSSDEMTSRHHVCCSLINSKSAIPNGHDSP